MRQARIRRKARRRWSTDAVIAELRRIDDSGRVRMTANALIAAGHTGLASAIQKYIGSFDRARRLARVASPGRLSPGTIEHWDEERVVDEIRRRDRDGESLAYKQVPTKLVDAAVYHCESWKNAIEIAGLDYAAIRRSGSPWTRADLITALRVGARSGRRGLGSDGPVSRAVWLAARRAFGSTRAAIAAAGLRPDQMLRSARLTDRELATALRRLIRERPMMTLGDMHVAPLGRVVKRRFETIERGLRALAVRWKPQPDRRGVRVDRARSGRSRSDRNRISRT